MSLIEIFKDNNGKLSFSRTFSAVVLVHYIIMSSYIVYTKQTFPDIPDNLYLVLLSLYGANKLSNALSKRNVM